MRGVISIIAPAMTTGPLRQIQILRAPAGERSYTGSYSLDNLPRLADAVAAPQASIDVKLELTRDHRGQRMAKLYIDLSVMLECQRCLEAVQWRSQLSNELLLLTGDAPPEAADDQESILLEDGILDADALVEDEILLALPLAPRHTDDSDCGRAWLKQQAGQEKPAGPFAALAALKTKH